MAGTGGKRIGAGRKPKHEEQRAKDLSIHAITNHYGSLENGFIALLISGEPALIKFVFEHAFGKPTEKLQYTGEAQVPVIFKLDERFKDT